MKVIARIKGGLGNQLFCYAAARRLALRNNAELVIDDISGFTRDQTYRRKYALDHFSIPARKASGAERLEPFERYRRGFAKWRSSLYPFEQRKYLEQIGERFDARLLVLRLQGDICLDGLWQSEAYFSDIAQILRQDLVIKPPYDEANRNMAAKIAGSANAVALHMRWFDASAANGSSHNVSGDYYSRALALLGAQVERPHFFIFSDDPARAAAWIALRECNYTIVSHNFGDSAYADLWLMSQCKHFITGNSTFSWWGAWLGEGTDGLVITPDPDQLDAGNFWSASGMLPRRWLKL